MSELPLNDFLSELGKSTVSRINREQKSKEIPGANIKKEEKPIDIPKQTRQNKVEIQETQEQEDNEQILDEDFIDIALDYASVVIKTVKNSFESKSQRKKVFESIQSAINLYLGESQTQYINTGKNSNYSQYSQPSSFTSSELHPLDLTGKAVNMHLQKPQGLIENNLNIGVAVDSNGKKSADLSGLSNQDISNLRVLSGIDKIQE